jgi:hypothetical protein
MTPPRTAAPGAASRTATPASVPSAQGAPALPGSPFPLGATPGEHLGLAGTNFAIASSVATSVTLCLFDEAGVETQIPATRDGTTWQTAIDTYVPARSAAAAPLRAGGQLTVSPRSIAVLRSPRPASA